MDDVAKFFEEIKKNSRRLHEDKDLQSLSRIWIRETSRYNYTYNFTWLGRPVIQFPQDLMAVQELIWNTRPDLVIETGVAHGGSIIFSASMLELLGADGEVIGIDVDIRPHNRAAIEKHPLFKRITLVEGSSTDDHVIAQVRERAEGKSVLVLLDSDHSHDHVLRELESYSPLVRAGNYIVVFDTLIEDMPPEMFAKQPWPKGRNAKTAVHEFLKANDRFEIDKDIEAKLLITVAPDGYLRCVKD